TLPIELLALQEKYKLFSDITILNKWRNWRSGLTCTVEEVKLIGALDDCLVTKEKKYSPLDYKTKGSIPKDDGSQYYQTQLDCYQLMLRENGYPVSGSGVLVYYWPVVARSGYISFLSKYFEIPCSADAAIGKIKLAKEILSKDMPEASAECEYCRYEREKGDSACLNRSQKV
ncbi:hypothetical protein LCGC14_2218250, partial [marine sediment metagenome]